MLSNGSHAFRVAIEMEKQTKRIFPVCYIASLFIYVARLNFSMAAPGLFNLILWLT